MTRARRAATTLAASTLLTLGGVALSTPAQAQEGESKSSRAAVLKDIINDIGLHVVTEKGIFYIEDLKKNEQIPPASN
ncbi:hypothetical protein AB8O64_19690 [Streptomyces sp. QH1-20]|uniref:hypothetical protein n=1 Tax=Streptomyces sp. QH1-20 TaxID=3240934 RepID=UPI0035166BB5